MIKLIACDLDGTLLDDNKKLDSKIFDVVEKLKEKGIIFTVISGRNEELLSFYIDELNIDYPYVVNNGGNIYQNHKCLKNICIPKEYNNFLANTLYENDIVFKLFSIEGIYYHSTSDFFEARMKEFAFEQTEYKPNLDLSNLNIYKITSDYNTHLDRFEKVYKRIVGNCPEIVYLRADKNVYCVNSKLANKGYGLEYLCELLNIDIKDTMVFGDNATDISMFEKAKIAVIVNNAQDDIKKYADYICKDNNNHGVSDFIREYFNI